MDHRELEILNSTLRNLIVELQLEKTTIRNKAFTVLQDLLDRRSNEINELINSETYESDITWSGLFMALLEGMHQQVLKIQGTATTATLENKCGMYSHVMMRLVAVANANADQIPKKILLEKSLEILERNPDIQEYFGNCLFTVIDRYLVLSTGVWHSVKSSLYNMYLKILFQIVEKSVTNNFYVTCLSNAIDVGVQHLNISSVLEAHLVPLLLKIEAEPSESGKMNLLKVTYLIAFEAVVNKRIVTCQFMFQLAKNLLVTYNPTRIRDEHRIYIIKILDLIIIAETLTENPKALSPENWNTLLQGCTFIVEQEIERMDRSTYRINSNNSGSDAIFYDFAAKVCALTFWDSQVWSASGSEQPVKRMKYIGKYPALISRVETTSSRYKFSWRWMLILGKVLEMHPERIETDDYEQILQLLSEFQSSIQKPEHFQGFYLACRALLDNETPEKVFGDEKKIAEHWHKIVETAARNCSSINQISNENLMLIQLMMKYKKHNGEIFIESLLDTYFTNSINKSDESIQTLITLLLNFNINVLKDPADKIEKILSYLLLKQRVNAKTSIMKSQEKPNAELVARLIVICNIYKSTLNVAFKEKWLNEALVHGQELWEDPEYKKYKSSIESIKDAILIQLLQKPIFDETEITSSDHSLQATSSQESLCVIDDTSFLSFCHKIMPIESQMACSQATDDQEDVPDLMQEKIYNTSILVNAFNIFLQIRAIHLERIEEFQLVKRIGIIVGTLEQDFQTLDGTERYRPKFEMLQQLTDIFATRYEDTVLRFVRHCQWTNCFNWISKIIEQGIHGNRDLETDKRMLLKKLSLQIVAAYLTVEGGETVRAEDFFHTCLEAKTNVLLIDDTNDVEVIIELLATLVVSKRESDVLAEDISTLTALILRKHFLNIKIIEKFMPILPDFLKYFKDTSEERIYEVVMIIQGLVKASQNLYPLSLILRILKNVFKFFVKEYPSYGNIKSFCDLLFEFTNSACTRTRIASVQAFLYMIHPSWARYDNERAFSELEDFFKDIIDENLSDFREMQDDPDTKSSKMAIATQLFCTVTCISYHLRQKSTLAFLDICELSQPTSMRTIQMQEYFKILDNAMTYNVFQLFRDNIKHLLSHWIINEFSFSKFPFYVTGAESLEEFFTSNLSTMAIAIFTSNDSMLPKLCQSTSTTEEELLREVIPDLMIEILPVLSMPKENISSVKVEKAKKLIEKIQKLPDHVRILSESLDKILELLIQRLFDEDFIKEYLHTKVNSVGNDNLSHQNLIDCCNYLKYNIQNDSSNDPILINLCQKSPFKVQKLLLATEVRLSSAISHEQKIVCLSQYVWIFENIKIFIARASKNQEISALKEFFIINMVHVICDQINSTVEAVSKAAFYYFRKICEENLPIGPCFTFIVHSFVQNISKTENEKMIEFLEKLLLDQNFTTEIILLPDFQNNSLFKHLQDRVTVIRDAMNQNTLEAQIEQFFKIEYMTVETLKSLHTSLAKRKTEVIEMYKDAKKIRFSDEVNESVLHRLVAKLVSIVEGLDAEKGYEASRCLGELGAANLNTLALYDQSEHTCYKVTESEEVAIHQTLLNCLKDAIIDKDVKIKFVANEAAFQLAQTVIGRSLLEENSLLRWFLLIPKPRKQSILATTINLAPLSNVFVQSRREPYKTWIQLACKQLLQVFNDTTIIPLVVLKPDFAENLLPAVMKLCLALDDKDLLTSLNAEMKTFFLEFYETIKSGEESTFYRDKSIVKAMLMVFECCRIEDRCKILPRIQIDYLHLLKAAEFCNASFSCILYSQLWSSRTAASDKKINEIFVDVKPHEEVCASLRHAYHEVGIEDAEFHLLDPLRDRQQYLIANGAWNQALQEFDWNAANQEVLRENGFYELLAKESQEGGTKYEMAWRLSDWSLFDEKEFKNDLNGAFEKSHYEALKCLHQNDKTGVLRNIKTARTKVVEIIKTTATECPKNLYRCFALLELLQQIDDVVAVRFDKANAEELLLKWSKNDSLPQTEFKLTDLKLSQRVAVLKETGVVAKRTWVPQILPKTMLAVIENAISAEKDNVAFKNIAIMKKSSSEIDMNYLAMMNLEYAKLNWKHKNEALAKQMFQELTKKDICHVVTIESHFLHGYHVKSSLDDPMKTFEDYFLKAHTMVMRYASKEKRLEQMRKGHYDIDPVGQDLKKLSSIFEKIAKFFDKQYKHLSKYLVSTDYLKRKSVVERQEYSAQKLREKLKANQLEKDERSQLRVIEANFKLDKINLEKYKNDRDTYLANALRYYGYACRYSSDESLHIFRIVSLFLSHKNITSVREVILGTMKTDVEHEVLMGLFDSLPSYKFLDILPQLTAHLYNDTEPTYVDDEIYKLLRRCAIEHPHHTLNHIMSMKNSYADKSSQDRGQQTDSRVRGAEKLLHDIERVNESLATLISQLTSMTKALIRMANTKLRENAGDCQLTRNTDCGILNLKNLNAIHCPTFHLPVMKSGRYNDVIVTIQKWEAKVGVLNGINAPKKFKCLCSDGVLRPQLLKGNDDLRQDAVMQQVFNIMNTMLAQNPKSVEKRLLVRTYKVIPFSRRSGMLEWCDNTIPIGAILTDCHKRYRPHDKYSPNDARYRVQQVRDNAESDKIKIFKDICKNLKPAFHSFFFEHFLTPGTFFERQYAYTNSVATNSIIGYILGIGDRHVQNILLDCTSTEVIHIDFGIAFEQGKCLQTPETVPFRLTRDIVAGMGVTGTEGVFRKSAEITMQVLRDHQHTILAILQVLLYDPLYMWTLTPEKARRTQSLEWEPEVLTNTTAERALELSKDKLNGAENSSMGNMSIENQVDKLIREAMSHDNLSKLFSGWQAYL